MKWGRIRKFLVSALATAAITAQAAVTDGVITPEEWRQIAITALGTTLVYFLRNDRPTRDELLQRLNERSVPPPPPTRHVRGDRPPHRDVGP